MFPRFAVVLRVPASMYALLYRNTLIVFVSHLPSSCKRSDSWNVLSFL